MRQFVVLRKNDSGIIDGYFDGTTFVSDVADSKLFPNAQEGRAQAGILQKDELDSEVTVKGATLTIAIDA